MSSSQEQDEKRGGVIPVLACVLSQLCARNDKIPGPKHVSKFHALRPPDIPILAYLKRIGKYSMCSSECFVLALVYIDRVIQSNPNFTVNSYNIHRLLVTSVMLGAKFFDDRYCNNAYYAKVGGVTPQEINALEVEFLFMLNFSLYVTTDTYVEYFAELNKHVRSADSCGCQRERMPHLRIPDPSESLRSEGAASEGKVCSYQERDMRLRHWRGQLRRADPTLGLQARFQMLASDGTEFRAPNSERKQMRGGGGGGFNGKSGSVQNNNNNNGNSRWNSQQPMDDHPMHGGGSGGGGGGGGGGGVHRME